MYHVPGIKIKSLLNNARNKCGHLQPFFTLKILYQPPRHTHTHIYTRTYFTLFSNYYFLSDIKAMISIITIINSQLNMTHFLITMK